jgi:hypothetical protein
VAHSDKLPFWCRLSEALQPSLVHFAYCGRNPDCTRFLSFALDTSTCWFVEFEIHVRQTTRGMPCVGLVDASDSLSAEPPKYGQAQGDLSRQKHGKLAVSFSPECDKVFVNRPNRLDQLDSMFIEFGTDACHEEESNWTSWNYAAGGTRRLCRPYGQWNTTVKVGILVKDRQLSFMRWNARKEWCSSRVVFGDLPDQVIPAIFLSKCAGYATAEFVNLSASPPEMCTRCNGSCNADKPSRHLWPCDGDDDDVELLAHDEWS